MTTLAEQVAELERERDRLKDVAVELEQKRSEMQRRLWVQEGYTHDERQRAERAEASLASAKVEGAREALTRYAEKSFDFAHMFRFRDREYPASGEGRRAECGVCKDAREVPVRGWPNSYSECPKCRPTPPSAPEPLAATIGKVIQDIRETAQGAVAHVGAANYRERQEEAHDAVDKACDAALAALAAAQRIVAMAAPEGR